MILGLCGCAAGNSGEPNPEKIQKKTQKYLNDLYEDTFTPRTYTSSNWAYTYESLTFTSEAYPGGIVEVRVYQNEDGKYWFKDNYYQHYMYADAVSYGQSLLGGEIAEVKVRFPNTVWSDELSGKTFAEWKASATAQAEFFVITKEALSPATQEEIANKMAGDKVSGRIVFYTTGEADLLQSKTLAEILNNQRELLADGGSKYTVDSSFAVKAGQ